MKRVVFAISVMMFGVLTAHAKDGGTFERLRTLAGDWRGSLEWTGARQGTGTVKATYRETANHSAVIEDLYMDGQALPSMTSVYHMDGADLRMTHFCAAGNQPRLKATDIDEAHGIIHFTFVDGTNLDARPAHVTALELRFVSKDKLVLLFTFIAAGKVSVENIELQRG